MSIMYDRIQNMSKDELGTVLYIIYLLGNRDGSSGVCDDMDRSYIRDGLLNKPTSQLMPNGRIYDLFETLDLGFYRHEPRDMAYRAMELLTRYGFVITPPSLD